MLTTIEQLTIRENIEHTSKKVELKASWVLAPANRPDLS